VEIFDGWTDCRFMAQLALDSGTSLLLPQYEEHFIGLLYLRSGAAVLEEDGGAEVTVEARMAALYACWRPQRLHVRQGAALLVCGFRCEQGEELLARRLRTGGAVSEAWKLPDAGRLLPQLEALSPALEQSPAVRPAAQLLERLLGKPEHAEIPSYLREVRRLIDTRYAEELTLEGLAEQVGRSKFHLSRAFRDYYHMTPGNCLTSVRLSRAAELLAHTDLPVREIGQRVGLTNNTYFTALFKRQYGRPPREYRLAQRAARK